MRDSSGTRRYISLRSVNTEIKWRLEDEEREGRTTKRRERESERESTEQRKQGEEEGTLTGGQTCKQPANIGSFKRGRD